MISYFEHVIQTILSGDENLNLQSNDKSIVGLMILFYTAIVEIDLWI